MRLNIDMDSPISFQQDRTVEFVDSLKKQLKCVSCGLVLRDAMQTLCGCRVCQKCIEDLLATADPVDCPGKNSDCEQVSLVVEALKVRPDFAARKDVGQLQVKCTNKGCNDTGRWKKLQSHIAECPYTEINCDRCDETIIRKDKQQHDRVCNKRPTVCQLCHLELPWDIYQYVHTNIMNDECCESYSTTCPYCKLGSYNKNSIKTHSEDCPKWKQPCDFKSYGCLFSGTKEERNSHSNSSTSTHLHMVMTCVGEKLGNMKQVEEDLQRIDDEIKTITPVMERAFNRAKTSHAKVAECMQKVYEVEERLPSRGDVVPVSRPVNSGAEMNIEGMNMSISDLVRKIQGADITSDGMYVWRIDGYREKKERARRGEEPYVDSPPFLTSKFGYRMRLRAYIYGDGVGRGSHVSLFFVIMRGDYDPLLRWPFKQKVTISILDQLHGNQPIRETLRPTGDSACYQRPTSLQNVAAGSPRFVSHNTLETSRHFKISETDTLFVKVNVDKAGHPEI